MLIRENKNYQKIFLLALFLGALILRLPTLGSPLAGDEAITFNHYAHLNFLELLLNYYDSNQHSFFSILSNFSLLIFGDHEVSFRLPSLIAGVLAIPLAYYTCRSLGFAQTTSFISSSLLMLYVPHISYSQEGRGYALSVFLALSLVYSSIQILRHQRLLFWGGVLVASATCIVITLPSNAVFVAGAGGFCWALRSLERLDEPGDKGHSSYLVCYVLSFFLIAGYLLVNLADLQLSAAANQREGLQWRNLWGIAEFLVSPWGFWLYLFFIVGFISNLRQQIRYGFLALFLIPIVLSLVTGIVGFARIYISFAPFVFMLVSIGIFALYEKIRALNKNLAYTFSGFSLLWILSQPFLALSAYYPERVQGENGYMRDATQLQEYFDNKPFNILPVIMTAAPGRSILNHYLGENIWERIKLFAVGKQVEKILFISQKGMPPNRYNLHQVFEEVEVRIPEKTISLIETFGSFQVFQWNVELTRMGPEKTDLDYENYVTGLKKSIETYTIENPKAVGHTSLLINNPGSPSTSPTIFIVFPQAYDIDMGGNEGFILNLFLKASQHKTLFRTMMVNNDASRIPSAYLNPYLNPEHSYFIGGRGDGEWEIVNLLSSIGTGKKILREVIETAEKKTLIDGVQSYLIKPIN